MPFQVLRGEQPKLGLLDLISVPSSPATVQHRPQCALSIQALENNSIDSWETPQLQSLKETKWDHFPCESKSRIAGVGNLGG